MWITGNGRCYAARPKQEGRNAVNKIKGAVSMKTAVKESKEKQHCGDEKEAEDSQSEERS